MFIIFILNISLLKTVVSLTWCFEYCSGPLGPGWCNAHLGCHASPPRAGLGHLGHCSSFLTSVFILALSLRGRGRCGGLPAGGAAVRIHVRIQLFLHFLQVLRSDPAAAYFLFNMLGPASFLGLGRIGFSGCQRKQENINIKGVV